MSPGLVQDGTKCGNDKVCPHMMCLHVVAKGMSGVHNSTHYYKYASSMDVCIVICSAETNVYFVKFLLQLCLHQRCVSRSYLNVPACPTGSDGLICSGNGVCSTFILSSACSLVFATCMCVSLLMQQCNTKGQCSCDVGFVGSACQSTPSGPGVCLQVFAY